MQRRARYFITLPFLCSIPSACGGENDASDISEAVGTVTQALVSPKRSIAIRFQEFLDSGSALTQAQLQVQVDGLNKIFAAADIQFFIRKVEPARVGTPFTNVSSGEIHYSTDPAPQVFFRPSCSYTRPAQEFEHFALFRAGSYCSYDGEILVYIAASTDFGAMGVYPSQGNAVIMGRGNLTGTMDRTFSHEMGHYLGLPHAFQGGASGWDLFAGGPPNPETAGTTLLSDFWDLVYKPASAMPVTGSNRYFTSRADALTVPEGSLKPIHGNSSWPGYTLYRPLGSGCTSSVAGYSCPGQLEGALRMAVPRSLSEYQDCSIDSMGIVVSPDGSLCACATDPDNLSCDALYTGNAGLKGLAFTLPGGALGVNVMAYNYAPTGVYQGDEFAISASQIEQVNRVITSDYPSGWYQGTYGRRNLNGVGMMKVWEPSFSDTSGWNQAKYYTSLDFPTVTSDTKSDACARGVDGIVCAVNVNGSGFSAPTVWSSTFSNAQLWDASVSYYSTIRYPDIGGSTAKDVCGRGSGGIWCATSNGSTAFTGAAIWNSSFNDAQQWNLAKYYKTIAYPDISGDGDADNCGRGSGGIWCGVSNGSSFTNVHVWESSFTDGNGWDQAQYYETIQYPKIDAGSRADVCGRGSGGIYCAVSNGSTAFTGGQTWTTNYSNAGGWGDPKYYRTIRFPDVNQDGKADVCGRASDGIYCATSDGVGAFVGYRRWTDQFGGGWDDPKYYSTITFVDVDGDNKLDVCGRGVAAMYCAYNDGHDFVNFKAYSYEPSDAKSWSSVSSYSTLKFTQVNPASARAELCGRGSEGILCQPSL